MNNDKRLFAIISLILLLAAILVPLLIFALGGGVLATWFGLLALILALIFGTLGWSEKIGRSVVITTLLLWIAVVGLSAFWAYRGRQEPKHKRKGKPGAAQYVPDGIIE